MPTHLLFLCTPAQTAEEILFQEDFNTDGEGTRYTSAGRFVSETDDHTANGVSVDQVGPVYWGHSSEISLVGVPGPTAARRAVISWYHELTADDVTQDAFEMIDATIAWLTEDKANLRVLFSPAPMGDGDTLLVERLTANGATVTGDDIEAPLPAASDYDLVIHSSQGAQPSRFTNFPVPYLTFNGPDHDDELVGTIGLSETKDIGEITVAAPEHPAAGGKTGSFRFFAGEARVDFPGTGVPDGSTVVATYPIVDIPPVTSLADFPSLISGAVETVVDEGTIPAADLESGESGAFSGVGGDNPVPGTPLGSFATVATGSFTVKEPGTYGFALWVAGGAQLRIDADGNGLDENDPILVQDQPLMEEGLLVGTTTYGDVTFLSSGSHAFEWLAYSPNATFGAEIFFTFVAGADQRDPVDNQEKWAPLADWEGNGIDVLPINLDGDIAVTKYEQPSQIIEERPLIVAINGPDEGGQVFGGGAFIDFEGDGYFAGAALNKFNTEADPKTVTLNSVDLTGETDLKLKVLLAATTLDFETSDYLDIKIDPDGSGTFQDLIHFTAPSGNDKFFSDGTTDLNIAFQEVTYDLPDGITNLTIRIESLTTWWNEVVAIDDIRVVKEVPDPIEPSLPPLDLLVLGADDTGETGADAQVLAFLREQFGAEQIRYANSGATTGEESADVIIMSSTFGSGTVRGKFHQSPVPIVNWEEAIMDASADGEFGQSAVVITKSTDTTQMTLGDHPIAGEWANTTIDFLTEPGAETLGSSMLSEGTTAVGTAANGSISGLSMLFVTDAMGAVVEGAGVSGNVSPARRVAFSMTDSTFDSLTEEGKTLLTNAILWAAGEIGGDPRREAVALSDGALRSPRVVDLGELEGDATYEFSFLATIGGASTAIAGSETWGIKLDQWNNQGVFGTTEFGVADHVFTPLDGKRVASVFDRDVHVAFVSESVLGETRLYIDGEHMGTWQGTLGLAGESSLMQARVAMPVDAMGDGSVLYGWATYNSALTAEDIAVLATTPFPEGTPTPGSLAEIRTVAKTSSGFQVGLSEDPVDLEYSTDLVSWEVIASDVRGTYEDTDAGRQAAGTGYYRAARR